MDNKQESIHKTNTVQNYNTIDLLHTSVTLSQYIIYNLFRVLRPIRHKYGLTINEIIILNGMMIYNKFTGSSFSYTAIMRYVGYFNDKKIRYYIQSLQDKGYIVLSDILNGNNRYKLTDNGIDAISNIEECYQKSLNKFINDNGISV